MLVVWPERERERRKGRENRFDKQVKSVELLFGGMPEGKEGVKITFTFWHG